MSLDSRAVRASRSIQAATAGARPASMTAVSRRHRVGLTTALAFAGVLAGTSIALASMLPATADDDLASTPPTTAAPTETTLPGEPGPPIVVPPDGSDDLDDPEISFEGTLVDDSADDPYNPDGWRIWSYGWDWSIPAGTIPEKGEATLPQEITAHQAYGTSSSADPYEKVYGTAPPGTRVLVSSEYGSADTTVGSSGEFSLKVFFSGMPEWQWFPLTATVGDETFSFSFKWTPASQTEVSASQYYGPENDQAYDKVYGTAPPGTVVIATSDYGSADTTVGSSGEYYLKIHFSGLPADQWITWTAKLKKPDGTVLLTKTFDFKWTPVYEATAAQKWGPVSAEPSEKIYGTAPPGSLVSASSPFGSASMTVGGEGSYALVIDFDSPTPDEPFTIQVTISDDGDTLLSKSFSFTYSPE